MISLNRVTLRRGTKVVLDAATAIVHPGEKVGLVGRNGAGKSTLFALLSGTLHEDAGDFSRPAAWRLAQVAQHMPETDEPATAFVLAGDERLAALKAQLADAERCFDNQPEAQSAAGVAIARLHTELADAGEHDAVSRAQTLILGLGFKLHELEQPVNTFSGGWRMRLQLARALMAPSDLLLLDEPTNHLDLDALVWLEGWLARYPGTLIVISHDREFLDAITTATLHIDQGKLTRYAGHYSSFELQHAQQLVLAEAAYTRQQVQIAHLQSFIDRFKAKATKARQAQSRVKALERMEKRGPVLASRTFSFDFKPPAALPNPMLRIEGASLGYAPAPAANENGSNELNTRRASGAMILQGVDRTVLPGQRIGILGANGQGKSTFVKTVAGEIAALAGTLTPGKGLTIGYFAQQELDVLHADDHALGHLVRLAKQLAASGAAEGASEQALRGFLGSFQFEGDTVFQPVGTLSGGEKARLVLAMLVYQRPNLLLLDEPTNHLDMPTRDALAMALNGFDGTVMLVSHDRALLRAVCDEFWLVGDGRIADFDGDLEDYQRYLIAQSKAAADALSARAAGGTRAPVPSALAPAAAAPPAPAVTAKASREAQQLRRQQSSRLNRQLQEAAEALATSQTEQAHLHARLASSQHGPEIAELGRQLKSVDRHIADQEELWLNLSLELEALQAGG